MAHHQALRRRSRHARPVTCRDLVEWPIASPRALGVLTTPVDLLRVRITVAENAALVELAGEIDFGTSAMVFEAVEACLYDRARTVSVDLSGVTFCDCTGFNVFVAARNRVAARGGTLRLVAASPPVVRVFALLEGAGLLEREAVWPLAEG